MSAGRRALQSGDYTSARQAFVEAVFMAPNSAEANHGVAFAAEKQGDAVYATRYYCKARELANRGSSLADEVDESLQRLGVGSCP
jgi:Tfp pilus assembly protein PilF